MGIWRFNGGQLWHNKQFVRNEGFDIQVETEDDRIIEVSDNALLVPAIIDFHCHIWAPGAEVGVTDTEYLSSGIAGCVDAGTFGYDGWTNADRIWQSSSLHIRSWLSVLPEGLTIHPNPNPTKPENISLERLIEQAKISNNRLLGYKVRLGQVDEKNDRELLNLARKAADSTNLKVMVHITDSYLDIKEVVSILKPGDILTHPYHGNRGSILDDQGNVSQAFIEAVENGLILDVGQGSKHFSWEIFQLAMAEGLKPDTISTDIVRNTWKKDPVNDLCYVLSKFITAGISKEEAIYSVLEKSEELMGIKVNRKENLVILELIEEEIHYGDALNKSIKGDFVYKPVTQIINRKVITSN